MVIGLGLLEAIPEETLKAWADPDDADQDGISGRINYVDNVLTGELSVGRFGWKSNQPTLRQQSASAFFGDIGITSPMFPEENRSSHQPEAMQAVSGGQPELSKEFLDKLTFYVQTLAVPARRNLDDPMVIRGEQVFKQANCTACHKPEVITGVHDEVEALSLQKIRPYTNLLLHDMGPGLADHRPDFQANGREWRTPPLWGIGLVKTVNKHTFFLHDGRARNLMEAILWHGGEAEASKEYVRQLPKADREALIAFLESL